MIHGQGVADEMLARRRELSTPAAGRRSEPVNNFETLTVGI